MVYLKKILVTTDLSQFSLEALQYAQSFGLLYASRIYLLYVEEHAHHRGGETAVASLAEFVARNVDPDVRISQVVRTGHAAEEITRFSREENVDLIVMATHGRTGVKHALLGSVAEKVVRFSAVPVMAVKPLSVREGLLRDEDIENELHLR
ncbi:MAG TPA: universal stress protein [Bacteroidota bacterium]|nr:universal stress protein [Bacteroidota bacterium]